MNNIGSKVVFGTDVVIIGLFFRFLRSLFMPFPVFLVTYMRNIVGSATRVLNPLISELESKGEMLLIKTAMVRGTKLSLLVALPISVVFLIMGESFISLWVGNEYGERTVLVLSILTMGLLLLWASRHK